MGGKYHLAGIAILLKGNKSDKHAEYKSTCASLQSKEEKKIEEMTCWGF